MAKLLYSSYCVFSEIVSVSIFANKFYTGYAGLKMCWNIVSWDKKSKG